MQIVKIPGGKKKGTPITAADVADIEYWANRISGDLAKDPNKNFADKDREWVEAAKAELARRNAGGTVQAAPKQAAPAQSAAIQTVSNGQIVQRPPASLSGSYKDPQKIKELFFAMNEQFHVVRPPDACDVLPLGYVVAISVVQIDADTETYGIPNEGSNERGLSKTALDKLASAGGLSWMIGHCRRVDDNSHPHYCLMQAAGQYRDFGGSWVQIVRHKQMDLRDGSTTLNGKSDKWIEGERNFIMEKCESKAMNRVTRVLGVKPKYTRQELQKPFLVAKMLRVGAAAIDDPELKRIFAIEESKAANQSQHALYGAQPQSIARLPQASRAPQLIERTLPPPPVGTTPPDIDPEPTYDTTGDEVPAAVAAQAQASSGDVDRGTNPDNY